MPGDLVVSGIRYDTSEMLRGQRRIERSVDQIERKVRGLGTTTRRTGSSFRNLAGVAVAAGASFAAVDAIVGRAIQNLQRTARFVFNVNRQYQVLSAQLKTVTGSAEQAAEKFALIEDFARTTPFEIANLTQGFVRLRAFGFDPTRDQLEGVGNLAAAFGRNFADLSDAVVSAANGMIRPIRSFGVDASISGDKITLSFQGVTRTVDRSAESIAEFLAEMGNTGSLATAMEERMRTLDGAISNLSDTAFTLARNFGDQGLNAELADIIRSLDDALQSSDELARSFGGALARAVDQVTSALARMEPLLSAVVGLIEDFGGRGLPGFGAISSSIRSETDVASLFDQQTAIREQLSEQIRAMNRAQADLARFGDTGNLMGLINVPESVPFFGQRGRGAAEQRFRDAQARVRDLARLSALIREQGEALARGSDGAGGGGGIFGDGSGDAAADELEKPLKVLRLIKEEAREAAAANRAVFEARDAFRTRAAERDRERRRQFRQELSRREFQRQLQERERMIRRAEQFGDRFASGLASAITRTRDFGEAFHQMITGMIQDIARLTIQRAITQPLLNAIFGQSIGDIESAGGIQLDPIPTRAAGGPVGAGQTTLVGERGPELFVPGRAGTIVSNESLAAGASDPPIMVSVTQNFPNVADAEGFQRLTRQHRQEIARAVHDELNKSRAQRRSLRR